MSIKRYAIYFGEMTRHNGQPQLNDDEFRRMMNIVYLDGKLAGIKCIRSQLIRSGEEHRFDIELFKVGKQLTEITGNTDPKELLDQMVKSE